MRELTSICRDAIKPIITFQTCNHRDMKSPLVDDAGPSRRASLTDQSSCKRAGMMVASVGLVSNEDVALLVRRILDERSINATVSAESDLRDIGLTSLDMVALVLSVEAEFNLTIPETQITPANFRSISSINALVSSLRS